MAERIAEVYDALREAGVSDDKARSAAIAVTGLRDEPWRRAVKVRLERIDGTLRLHAWILATNTAMLTALLFKVFAS